MRSGITHRWLRGSLFLTVLLVLVGLPLLFIILQAIFPRFSSGSLEGAFSGVAADRKSVV